MAKVKAPEHPSIQTLLGSMDAKILKIAKQVCRGECIVVPSVLPIWWHDECMRELCQELTKCMARAGLQGKPRPVRPTTRRRRCSMTILPQGPIPLQLGLGGRVGQVIARRPLGRASGDKKATVPL